MRHFMVRGAQSVYDYDNVARVLCKTAFRGRRAALNPTEDSLIFAEKPLQ